MLGAGRPRIRVAGSALTGVAWTARPLSWSPDKPRVEAMRPPGTSRSASSGPSPARWTTAWMAPERRAATAAGTSPGKSTVVGTAVAEVGIVPPPPRGADHIRSAGRRELHGGPPDPAGGARD